MPASLDYYGVMSAESLGWACEPRAIQCHVSSESFGAASLGSTFGDLGDTGWGIARVPGESQVEPLVAKTVVSGACSASAVGNQGIGGVSVPCLQDGDVLPVSSSGAADHGVLESHKPTAAPEPHNPVLLSASPLAQIPSRLPCAVGRSDAAAEGVALNASKLFSDGSDDDALSLSEAEAEGFQCSPASRVARVPPHPGMFPNSPSATEVSTSAAGLPCVAAVQVVHRGPLDGPRDDEVVSLSSSGGEKKKALSQRQLKWSLLVCRVQVVALPPLLLGYLSLCDRRLCTCQQIRRVFF